MARPFALHHFTITMDHRQVPASRNPFSHSDRNNFPGVDRALSLDDENDNRVFSSQEQRMSPSPDHSICSHSSSLNMSIGARAALNEHLQHVALHGIDGHYALETSASFERLPQDEIWDCLLDGNLSVTSASYPSLFDRLQPVSTITEGGEEEIEIAFTDVSGGSNSDYFNSSRVWQLETPERNKQIRQTIITRRGDEQYEESDSGSQASGMMYLYNVALGMHEQPSVDHHNSSFLSLGVDLSRISNSDVSNRSSPPGEQSLYRPRDVFSDDFVPFAEARTPSRRGSPQRRSLLSSPLEPIRFSPERQPISAIREYGEKENYLNDIGLSPIAAQAGSIAGKLGRPLRRQHPGDAFPGFSPSASPIARTSPISHTNSGFDFRNFPTVSENCILDMDDEKDSSQNNSSHTIDLKPREQRGKCMSSLSSISAATASLPKHSSSTSSDDHRIQYRTVVPSRVFMDEADNFPFQEDSFSSRSETVPGTSSDSEISILQKSLLVSFDDAAGEYEVALLDET